MLTGNEYIEYNGYLIMRSDEMECTTFWPSSLLLQVSSDHRRGLT